MKKITSLLIALVVVLSLAVPTMAASSVVDYYGHKLFDFQPGSGYTDTDLFEEFKGVMPGDVLYETVTVKNTAQCCDYIKIYLQAIPHNASNPLSDGKGTSVDADETISSMENFLSKLTLTVTQDKTTIYSGPANQMDEMKQVCLGTLSRNKSLQLDLMLEVPIDLDNEYAFREGEIDWKFSIEEYDYNSDNPKSGDHMQQYMLPAILVMAFSASGLLVLLVVAKRKKKK